MLRARQAQSEESRPPRGGDGVLSAVEYVEAPFRAKGSEVMFFSEWRADREAAIRAKEEALLKHEPRR